MLLTDYRKAQFIRLSKNKSEFKAKLQIIGNEGNRTNWLNIEDDELQQIKDILTGSMPAVRKVHVSLQGGLVQGVTVPEGVEVVVYDFDTDGTAEEDLSKALDGSDCIKSIYEHIE